MPLNLLMFVLLVMVGAAHGAETAAVQRCAAQLQAEQTRIERDFSRDRPPASDKAAYDRWAQNFHAALNAAGRAAESCERQSQPVMTPDRRAALDACLSKAASQLAQVDRQYAGRTPSLEDQAKMRAEYQALHEQRIACDLASRR